MKKYIPIIAIILIFIIGVGVLSYPLVSSVINNYNMRQNAEVQVEQAAKKPKPEIEALFKEADEYNSSLINTVILTDPFDEEAYEKIGAHYEETFDVDGKGLIGYVDIPKINVYLPIYHGVSSEVLSRGAGHLDNTSFPVGGPSTHSVISAHSAFPTETFFDYLTDMEEGDEFYIHVLDRVLKYEVDQIKVVLPDDTSNLYVINGEDHVTLLTCTPYSINTHRLLVRGKRVPYDPSEGESHTTGLAADTDYIYILGYRISYLTAGISIAVFIVFVVGLVFLILFSRRRSRRLAHAKKDGDSGG